MKLSYKSLLFCLIPCLLVLSSCNSDSSELRKKAASEVTTKTVNNQSSSANARSNVQDHYGADLKTITIFTVNWIMRIKEDGSGSFGQGQNGNLYAKIPKESFDYEKVLTTLSAAIKESGSFGESVAFTVSGGAKVQKPKYIENFDYCKSLFSDAYGSLSDEEKAKIEENYKKTPPVSAYNY